MTESQTIDLLHFHQPTRFRWLEEESRNAYYEGRNETKFKSG